MSTANKRKGADYELDLVKWFRLEGVDTERLRLSGKNDEGDIVIKIGGVPYVIEAKNEKQFNLAGWTNEARVEAINYARARGIAPVHRLVVAKRRNHSVAKSYAIVEVDEWLRQQTAYLPF